MSRVNKTFSFNSDPCTSLPSPHQHRWTARVEKLGSQAYICAFAMTPGSAHMARMKIFINNIEGNGEGKELEASTYGSWDRCAGSSTSLRLHHHLHLALFSPSLPTTILLKEWVRKEQNTNFGHVAVLRDPEPCRAEGHS